MTRKQVRLKTPVDPKSVSKAEFVTGVLALLGGATRGVAVDELALACHRLEPQSYSWPEYAWLPNLDMVRVTLVDVSRAGAAETITNGRAVQKLWRLTGEGQRWAAENGALLTELRRRLPDEDIVAATPEQDLAAVAVQRLVEAGEALPVRRERVLAEAYRAFPKVFGLSAFPGWPDSARIDKAIQENRGLTYERDLVTIRSDYTAEAQRLAKSLSGEVSGFGAHHRKAMKSNAQKAVKRVEGSRLYASFKVLGATADLDSGEICDLLSLTLEASPEVTRTRLGALKALLEEAERWDLSRFVEWVRTKLAARNWHLVEPMEVRDE